MRYRVIEGGYWRHDTLHIESDPYYGEGFVSDASGKELYREMAVWLIENNEMGYYHNTFTAKRAWPEFFGVYDRPDGIIDVYVNEEGCMWFIPETHEHYMTPAPKEAVMDSWLHPQDTEAAEYIWFEDLFPDGYTIPAFTIKEIRD